MATSDKLTYLNTTKTQIKGAINNAGANITNDTFRSYATTLGTRITKMRIDYETALSYLPMDTKTNTSVSITDAVDLPTYNFELTKESSQNTTTGRNLLPIIPQGSVSNYGVTLTSNGDGSFTVNGLATQDGTIVFRLTNSVQLPNENIWVHIRNPQVANASIYFDDGGLVSSSPSFNSINKIYSSGNLKNMNLINVGFHFVSGTNYENFVYTPSLELTDNVTDYEPYTGGIPAPNTSFPMEVNTIKTSVTVSITDGTNIKTITIPLNNNEVCGIGDYKDELIVDKNGHCWLNKKIGKMVFVGTETWSTDGDFFYTTAYGKIGSSAQFLCNYATYRSKQPATALTDFYLTASGSYFPEFSKYNFADTSAFKTWLSTHNIIVYYPLETPTLIDLNYNVDLTLYEGSNTITNSETAPMEITYVEDINTILATLTTPSNGGNE